MAATPFRARPMDDFDHGPTVAVWDGFLARGEVAVLGGGYQVGKTTLLAGLLRALAAGGPFLGRDCAAGTAVVVACEARAAWAARVRAIPVGAHAQLVARPFAGRPTPAAWAELVAQLDGFDLIAVDNANSLAPGGCGSADFLDPLRRRADAGAAVLVTDTDRYMAPLAADVRLDLRRVGRGGLGPRRRLTAVGRRAAEAVYEWVPGTPEFRVVPDDPEARFRANWDAVRERLTDRPATQRELLSGWPADRPAPSGRLLYDWLRRASAAGLAARTGSGRRADPFRFARPGSGLP